MKLALNQIATSKQSQNNTAVMGSPAKSVQVEPLTNLHVALESIQPGKWSQDLVNTTLKALI